MFRSCCLSVSLEHVDKLSRLIVLYALGYAMVCFMDSQASGIVERKDCDTLAGEVED